ncbi:protein HIGH ARSENIC CONTENT 1, mitochondrial-like [Impatiens glandulifera]|uniref:protein HIGH ARSENIC CONTENT 1, mitochondrial-like n=1 Tax=Impatiens glandulifera TaxID=253017 RepID=UPI001FB09C0F|nr:protein HIGH ARSENIC CONTENT 1, mitochondrial-like [Impatiens glandulifera]
MEETRTENVVVTVNVSAAKDLLVEGHRYLDVRTNEEFSRGHVDNALNVPYIFKTPDGNFINPEFLAQVSLLLQKDDSLVVGCNSGGRSFKACVDLLNNGYKNVTNLGGGYSAWLDHEFAGDPSADMFKTACKFRK